MMGLRFRLASAMPMPIIQRMSLVSKCVILP